MSNLSLTFLLEMDKDQFENAYNTSRIATVKFLFEAKTVFLSSLSMLKTEDSISTLT